MITAGHLRGGSARAGYTYDVAYPQLAGSSAAAQRIDAAIRHQASSMVGGFLSDIRGITVIPEVGPSEYTTTYSVALLTPRLVSFRVPFFEYVSGAAHPLDGMVTLSFELPTGRQLRLGDGFTSASGLLRLLSTQARHNLRASLGPDYDPAFALPGTEPTAANFAGWVLTDGGLEITFAEYQVGPYVLGMPVVTAPWATLRPLVDPAGPLAGLAGS